MTAVNGIVIGRVIVAFTTSAIIGVIIGVVGGAIVGVIVGAIVGPDWFVSVVVTSPSAWSYARSGHGVRTRVVVETAGRSA